MMKKYFLETFFLLVLFLMPIQATAREDSFRGPWKQPSAAIQKKTYPWNSKERELPSLFHNLVIQGLLFYQRTISPINGDRCPMYPSCSTYSVQSIKKHGFVLGSIMAAARLTQERGEIKVSPIIIANDSKLFFDPVENNDFWFNHE